MIRIIDPFINEEEIEAVREVLQSRRLIDPHGSKIILFERMFSQFIGVRYSVATNSGTAALHTCFASLKLNKDDEVITSPFSFVASADAILMVGAKPVFVDIELDTYTIDTTLIEDKITDKTRVIEAVHLYGLPCNMDEISKLANRYGLKVVEDAAQAHGAKYNGKMAGSLGDVSAFSFWPSKNITTGGGGMLVTNSEEIYNFAKLFRFAGEKGEYKHVMLGYDYVMPEIQAAIGIVQLNKINYIIEKRRRNA